MKKMFQKLFALSLSLILALSFLPAQGESAKPLEGKKLLIGLSPDFMFFETISTTDETGYEGLDIDIIKHLSEELGFSYEIVPMAFASLIGALQTGSVDLVISGMSYTQERAQVVDFSITYATSKIGCVTRADSAISSLEDLKGQVIACSQGTSYEGVIKAIEGSTLVTYQGQSAVGLAVAQGSDQVAAGITSSNGSKKLAATVLNESGEPLLKYFTLEEGQADEYNMAFPKGSELRAVFDAAIVKMQSSGLMQQLIEQWLY